MESFRPERRATLPYPPENYSPPPFPSLTWPPDVPDRCLYSIYDSWHFTIIWTLIIYAIFHLGAASVALLMQIGIGKKKSNWKYLWLVPLPYAVVALIEALCAGSVVGVVVGAVYVAGNYPMSTWIPFIWAWVNVLVLIVSSFTVQGGL